MQIPVPPPFFEKEAMKVHIKAPVSYFGPGQLFDLVFFWARKNSNEDVDFVWVEDLEYKWYGSRLFTRLNVVAKKFYVFRERLAKEKIQIDPWDSWSADSTIALIASPLLQQLKNTTHGAAYVDDSDVPEKIQSRNGVRKNGEELDCFFFDRWNWVLDEMIFAMDNIADSDKRYSLSEDLDVVEDRIANGCRLFGKYFQSLWD